ncbi:hypothetical protein EYF80_032144 [Liparis tanakae]|uniref:Uncharacterized protein n=1 Tax=Liparis tanakae TaxID=230148 RepID=A0A4Z2GYC9_9TELE|nr:hypothetical protein EYF80_032144 [Liparis tanakae]
MNKLLGPSKAGETRRPLHAHVRISPVGAAVYCGPAGCCCRWRGVGFDIQRHANNNEAWERGATGRCRQMATSTGRKKTETFGKKDGVRTGSSAPSGGWEAAEQWEASIRPRAAVLNAAV